MIYLAQAVIHADETTLKVINYERVKSYMWVYCSGADGPNAVPRYQGLRNIVLYDYQDGSRAGSCVRHFLATEHRVFIGGWLRSSQPSLSGLLGPCTA